MVNLFADVLSQKLIFCYEHTFVTKYQHINLPYFVIKYDKSVMNFVVEDILIILKENIV